MKSSSLIFLITPIFHEQEDEFGSADEVEDDVEEIEIFDEDNEMDFANENEETGIIVIDD